MAASIVAAPAPAVHRAGRRRRLAGGLGALALLLALATPAEAAALLLFAAAGVLLVGTALFVGRPRRLAAFLALNLAILALLGWALTERDMLVVRADGNRVEAGMGGVRLVGTAGFDGVAAVGLALSAAEERPAVARWTYARASALERAWLWLSTNVLSGVAEVAISAPDGRPLAPALPTVFQPLRVGDPLRAGGPVEGWQPAYDRDGRVELRASDLDLRELTVAVPIVRPGPDVHVTLRPPSGNPVVVRAAPDRRTFEIVELIGAEGERPLVGGLFTYRRTAAAWAQALIRELARPWLLALLLLGLAQLLAVRLRPALLQFPVPEGRAASASLALTWGLAAFALAAMVAHFILERLPHVQDSVTYLFQAEVFALGRLWAPAPRLPEFFEQEFILARDGRWFGKYPPGQPLVLALGVLAGAPWLVSPICVGIAVALTYSIGRRVYGAGIGMLAAALLVFSPFFLMLAGDMMAHPAGLLWATLLLACVVVIRQGARADGGTRLAWFGAGLALGMLFITRQLTAVAVGVAPLVLLVRPALGAPRRLPLRAVQFALGAVPPVLFLLAFNATLTGSPFVNPYELWWDFDRLGFGPNIGMHGGHDLANGLANTFANLTELYRHLWGWPAYLTLALAFVPVVLPSRNLWDWTLLATFGSLVLAYVFHWADGIMYGPRYYYEALAPLALLTARGAIVLASSPGPEEPDRASPDGALAAVSPPDPVPVRSSARVPSALPAALVLVIGLMAGNIVGYLPAVLAAGRGFNEIDRARLTVVENAGLTNAVVFVRQEWPSWQPYGSVFPANSPLLDTPVIFALDLGAAENWQLMAHYPERTPYLLDRLTLTEIRR